MLEWFKRLFSKNNRVQPISLKLEPLSSPFHKKLGPRHHSFVFNNKVEGKIKKESDDKKSDAEDNTILTIRSTSFQSDISTSSQEPLHNKNTLLFMMSVENSKHRSSSKTSTPSKFTLAPPKVEKVRYRRLKSVERDLF